MYFLGSYIYIFCSVLVLVCAAVRTGAQGADTGELAGALLRALVFVFDDWSLSVVGYLCLTV